MSPAYVSALSLYESSCLCPETCVVARVLVARLVREEMIRQRKLRERRRSEREDEVLNLFAYGGVRLTVA